jgi:predicted exporter
MYIAYALEVAIMVAVIVLNLLLFETFSVVRTFGMVVGAVIITAPLMNAMAEIIWDNFFFHYNKNCAEPLLNTK